MTIERMKKKFFFGLPHSMTNNIFIVKYLKYLVISNSLVKNFLKIKLRLIENIYFIDIM